MAFLRLTTPHGHIMAEVYSSFQKSVRRGTTDDALYWGAQIGRTYPNALKKRLLQHSLEDVGHIGYALALLAAKPKTWDALIPWLRILCELPKTRAAAWMNRVAVQYVADPSAAPSPLLRSAAEVLLQHRDERLEELKALFGSPALRLYKELNHEVLVFHCILLEKAGVVKPAALPTLDSMCASLEKEAALLDTPRDVPDFALDKHTVRGKRLGRGYAHFLTTMVVEPRLFAEADPFEAEARALYTDGKEQRVRHILALLAAPAIPSVPEVLAVVEVAGPLPGCTGALQAQLLTGKHKPRVWYATRDSKQLVIKGPVSAKERDGNLVSEALKVKLGLPCTNLHAEGDYLVMDSLIDYTKLKTHVVSSKLEKEVRVPLGAEMPVWDSTMLTDPVLALGVMKGLLFRKIAGANDTCARNFVVAGGAVHSIDDSALRVETAHMWKKELVREKGAYKEALTSVWAEMKTTVREWRLLLSDDAFAMAQLKIHLKRSRWSW